MQPRNAKTGEVRTVLVWDPVVRVFHWSLVASFVVAYLTPEASMVAHEIAGYTVLALVALRLVWGFLGSRHARFADFLRSPQATFVYLGALAQGRAPRFLGHNPAGGAMIIALIAAMVVISVSGHMMLTEQFFGVPWVETLHEVSVDVALVLVALHIAGVVGSSLLHRENLVWAMITGRKREADENGASADGEVAAPGSGRK